MVYLEMESTQVSKLTVMAGTMVIACLTTIALAEVKSGLQVGDYVDAFDVKDCSSGIARGKTLCYR
ncbi:MAG: hypothetical protein CMM03_00430 [Rhodopirellula sp.]|nr:hypothetical protein [Rhodopirellula sp.]|tara:strand:- start:470 stop:667 length:198 start_codon:yes stop_codon:yes gene_type:complete